MGCHFLLQGIFLTQGSNPRLLHWQLVLSWWGAWGRNGGQEGLKKPPVPLIQKHRHSLRFPSPLPPPKPMSPGPPCPHFIWGETEALERACRPRTAVPESNRFPASLGGELAPANKGSWVAGCAGSHSPPGGSARPRTPPGRPLSGRGRFPHRLLRPAGGLSQPRGPRASSWNLLLHRLPSLLSYRRTGFLFICRGLAQISLQSFPFADSLSSSTAHRDPCDAAQSPSIISSIRRREGTFCSNVDSSIPSSSRVSPRPVLVQTWRLLGRLGCRSSQGLCPSPC